MLLFRINSNYLSLVWRIRNNSVTAWFFNLIILSTLLVILTHTQLFFPFNKKKKNLWSIRLFYEWNKKLKIDTLDILPWTKPEARSQSSKIIMRKETLSCSCSKREIGVWQMFITNIPFQLSLSNLVMNYQRIPRNNLKILKLFSYLNYPSNKKEEYKSS